jgi:hypothetical protein
MTKPEQALLLSEMRASFERVRLVVADLDPTDETDAAKAETVASLKRELVALQAGIGGLEQVLGDSSAI